MHSFDTNLESFANDVVHASTETLIVMDFWAPWCGPCKTLMPVLEKLAQEYQGAFRLAKVNIDEQQQLAQQFAVRSVPTVKFISNGQIVDEFMGAIAENEIRNLLDKHIVRESDKLMQEALQRYQQGDNTAIDDMKNIINTDIANNNIRVLFANVLANEKQYEDASAILQALPAETRENPEVSSLLSRLEVMAMAKDFGDIDMLVEQVTQQPGDCDARLQLSNAYLANGDFENALEQLLEIMKRDRQFNDDAGRKGIIKVFEMLGNSGELVSRYRRKMAALLY